VPAGLPVLERHDQTLPAGLPVLERHDQTLPAALPVPLDPEEKPADEPA